MKCEDVLHLRSEILGDLSCFYLIAGFINVTINCCPRLHLLLVILDLQMVVSGSLLYYEPKNLQAEAHPGISLEQKGQSQHHRSNNACKQMLPQ